MLTGTCIETGSALSFIILDKCSSTVMRESNRGSLLSEGKNNHVVILLILQPKFFKMFLSYHFGSYEFFLKSFYLESLAGARVSLTEHLRNSHSQLYICKSQVG